MKKSRFSEHEIITILKEVDAGLKVNDACRQHGISSATYYQWKSKFGGMEAADIKRLPELEGELAQYKKRICQISLPFRRFSVCLYFN